MVDYRCCTGIRFALSASIRCGASAWLQPWQSPMKTVRVATFFRECFEVGGLRPRSFARSRHPIVRFLRGWNSGGLIFGLAWPPAGVRVAPLFVFKQLTALAVPELFREQTPSQAEKFRPTQGAVSGKSGIAEVLRLFTRFACALPSSTERLACAAVRKQFGAGA